MDYSVFKSKIVIGDTCIYITKKFNWFNRLMIKLIFGITVENVDIVEE